MPKFKPIQIKEGLDTTFFGIQAHGCETGANYVLPDNVRVIMFCYSGEILNVCPKFDRFIWKILTREYDNVFQFLKTIKNYSTLRKHFCVFESGTCIPNILLSPDEVPEDTGIKKFRTGFFQIPIDVESSSPGITDIETEVDVESSSPKKDGINIPPPRYSNRILKKFGQSESKIDIISPHHTIINDILLSSIIKYTLRYPSFKDGFTLILFVCREKCSKDIVKDTIKQDTVTQAYTRYRGDVPTSSRSLIMSEIPYLYYRDFYDDDYDSDWI